MATYSGVGGEVWTGAEDLNVRSWSISLTAGAQTGAHSTSAGWTQAIMGVKGWTATIEVYDDTTLAAAPPFTLGATVEFELWDGLRCFTGDGLVADVTYSCDIEGGGLVAASVSVQGTDDIAIGAVQPA